jgi:hypothetical protein
MGQQLANDARYSLMASSTTPPIGSGAVGLEYM